MNKFTLNQFILALTAFAGAHAQVNSFGFGDGYDIDSAECLYNAIPDKGKISFGAIWCIPQPSNITRSWVQHKFSFLFMDLVNTSEKNLNDVLSDQLCVAQDFCSWFVSLQNNWDNFLVEPEYNFPLTPFSEFTDEAVAGYKLDVTVKLINENDYCAVPNK